MQIPITEKLDLRELTPDYKLVPPDTGENTIAQILRLHREAECHSSQNGNWLSANF